MVRVYVSSNGDPSVDLSNLIPPSHGPRSSTSTSSSSPTIPASGHPDLPDDSEVAHYQQFTAALNELR